MLTPDSRAPRSCGIADRTRHVHASSPAIGCQYDGALTPNDRVFGRECYSRSDTSGRQWRTQNFDGWTTLKQGSPEGGESFQFGSTGRECCSARFGMRPWSPGGPPRRCRTLDPALAAAHSKHRVLETASVRQSGAPLRHCLYGPISPSRLP